MIGIQSLVTEIEAGGGAGGPGLARSPPMFDDVDRNRAHLPATRERTPSSRVLEDLLRQAPPDQFTLGWVLSTLHQRSFGVVILFLGVLATAPIGSSVPGIMRQSTIGPQCRQSA